MNVKFNVNTEAAMVDIKSTVNGLTGIWHLYFGVISSNENSQKTMNLQFFLHVVVV